MFLSYLALVNSLYGCEADRIGRSLLVMNKAASTRLMILRKAFELIYVKGYQATSVDDIIATTQVTKGAFYYHFKTKDEMGLAIVNDILKPTLANSFIQPMQQLPDPADAVYTLIEDLLLKNEFLQVRYGCPVSNLTQELAPSNADFKKILEEMTQQWMAVMTAMFEKGKAAGYVRKDVDARQVTLMVLSGYWGIRNLGKLETSKAIYLTYLKELRIYLNGIK